MQGGAACYGAVEAARHFTCWSTGVSRWQPSHAGVRVWVQRQSKYEIGVCLLIAELTSLPSWSTISYGAQVFLWLVGPPIFWVFAIRVFPKLVGDVFLKRIEHCYNVQLEKLKSALNEENLILVVKVQHMVPVL